MYALPLCTDAQIIWYNADVTEAAGPGRSSTTLSQNWMSKGFSMGGANKG